MPVVIACPACQQKMKVPDESALGRTVLCPGCHEAFAAERFDPSKAPPARPASKPVASPAPAGSSKDSSPSRPPVGASSTKRSDGKSGGADARSSKLAAAAASLKADAKAKPKAKSRPKDEEVLEAVEIIEEEDEWANLPAAAPRGSRSQKLPAAPPVVGRKKKSGDAGDGPVKKRAPGDGELSIGQHRLLMLGTGLVGALLMMGVWAGLMAWRGWGAAWMAWLVGIAVGGGVRVGASKWDYGLAPGISAALLTLVAILGGKAIAYNMLARHEAAEERKGVARAIALLEHENYQIDRIVQNLIPEKKKADPTYNEFSMSVAEEDSDDDVDSVADFANPENIPRRYNPAIWKEASEKWAAMSDEEKAAHKQQTTGQLDALKRGESVEGVYYADTYRQPVFHVFDLIWAAFAVVSAFRLATGMNDD